MVGAIKNLRETTQKLLETKSTETLTAVGRLHSCQQQTDYVIDLCLVVERGVDKQPPRSDGRQRPPMGDVKANTKSPASS